MKQKRIYTIILVTLLAPLFFNACAEMGSWSSLQIKRSEFQLASQLFVPKSRAECETQFQDSYKELLVDPVFANSCAACHGQGGSSPKAFLDNNLASAVAGFLTIGEIDGVLSKLRSGTHPGGPKTEEASQLSNRKSTWVAVRISHQQCISEFGG